MVGGAGVGVGVGVAVGVATLADEGVRDWVAVVDAGAGVPPPPDPQPASMIEASRRTRANGPREPRICTWPPDGGLGQGVWEAQGRPLLT